MEDKSEKDIPKWAFTPSPVEEETNVHEEVREFSVCFGWDSTASYNAFLASDVIWDGIRMQGINVWCLLIPKMYFSFDLIDVQLYTIKIWHPCIFSTKIWTSIKSSKKYIFGILKCHISTPCTQFPSQNPSPTYKPFKDTVTGVSSSHFPLSIPKISIAIHETAASAYVAESRVYVVNVKAYPSFVGGKRVAS